MRRPIIASVLFVLVACNAISGLDANFVLVPFDSGVDATNIDDAASTNDDAGNPDVVSADARSDGGSNDAFSCNSGDGTNVVFCTDFETDASWDDNELLEGTVAFEFDSGVGGTRGMHAHVDDATVSRRAALWKRLSGPDAKTYAHYDVEFDFMVASKTFPYAALGIFALTQPANGGGLRYYGLASFGDKTLDVVDDPPTIVPDKIGVDDVYGTWHRALINLDYEGSGTYSVSLSIDATTVDGPRSGFDFGDAQTAELRIGILFTSTAQGTMDLYLDNIIVRRVK